MELVTLDN